MRILGEEKGQSLVEVLGALAVALVVLLALVRVTIVSMRNANFAKNQALATQYAQETMESLRSCRDQDPDNFWEQNCSLPSLGGGFTRAVDWNELEEDEKMQVTVIFSWTDATGLHSSELTSYLTRW